MREGLQIIYIITEHSTETVSSFAGDSAAREANVFQTTFVCSQSTYYTHSTYLKYNKIDDMRTLIKM